MKFRLNKQVEKDLKKINDKRILIHFKQFLQELQRVTSILGLTGIKKMAGERYYYRYRLGNYRVGFKVEDNEVLILKVAHRKEIYRYFP